MAGHGRTYGRPWEDIWPAMGGHMAGHGRTYGRPCANMKEFHMNSTRFLRRWEISRSAAGSIDRSTDFGSIASESIDRSRSIDPDRSVDKALKT